MDVKLIQFSVGLSSFILATGPCWLAVESIGKKQIRFDFPFQLVLAMSHRSIVSMLAIAASSQFFIDFRNFSVHSTEELFLPLLASFSRGI